MAGSPRHEVNIRLLLREVATLNQAHDNVLRTQNLKVNACGCRHLFCVPNGTAIIDCEGVTAIDCDGDC